MKFQRIRAARALAFRAAPMLVAAMLITVTGTASFADFRPGRDAYMSGEYSRAFELFLPSALLGDTKSRIGLGLLLARGNGMDTDYVRSYAWHDAAVASGGGEHIVVQILARTNRDYLAGLMTAAELEAAKLRSAMLQAIPQPTAGFGRQGPRRPATAARPVKTDLKQGAGKAVTIADSGTPSRQYDVQLAALKSGHRTDLLMAWSTMAKRHKALSKLEPVLVRLDLKTFGTYDGLRAGSFEDVSNALDTCAALIADRQDCFVVAR